MCTRLRIPFWLSGCGTVMLGLLLLALPRPSHGQQPLRDQQISEIEKQLKELNKQLSDLKAAEKSGTVGSAGSPEMTLNPDWIKTLTWRSIGPAAMGGRIVAMAVFEADPSTYWIATASGGLLKTTNNGVTFEHQFDREKTVAIGDVCVAPSDRNVVWVGTGENNPRNSVSYGDGVYKSTDGGKTWKNMGLTKTFQIGKILIHPNNPNLVYVGALGRLYGPNPDRGLYKTTNGGETWEKILYVDDKTGVIDMRMHPSEPETLVVAMWERLRDEFDSWPGDVPKTDGYDGYDPITKWGPGSGLHKSSDGGKTWKKLAKGLPASNLGRIGLDWYRKDPNVVFAVIDCAHIGMGTPPRRPAGTSDAYAGIFGDDAETGARLTRVVPDGPAERAGLQVDDVIVAVNQKAVTGYDQLLEELGERRVGDKLTFAIMRKGQKQEIAVVLESRPGGFGGGGRAFAQLGGGSATRPYSANYGGQRENVQDQQGPNSHEYGGVYKSSDGGETWARINSANPRPMYFSQVRVDPSDDKYLFVLGVSMFSSRDGGKTFRTQGNRGMHPDQHALWIDPRDGRHMIVGCDGGFYATYDRAENWDHLNHKAIGQFYHVAVDNRKPYHALGGLQDNGSWAGPSQGLRGAGPINEDWIVLGGGDGFVCRVDPQDPDLVYFESQDGNMNRRNLRTGERGTIRPRGHEAVRQLLSYNVPFVPTGWFVPFASRSHPAQAWSPYRFNWNTPFILSSHNPRIFYCAGNYVFRSVKQGDDLKPISPEITRTQRGSGTALAECPRNPDVVYAGTDDGFLWITRNGGAAWTNLTDRLSLPGPRWVASIEPSRFVEGRAYVVFDAHRSNDDEPYVFVTEDFGQTWSSLRANLPSESTRVLREDVLNPNLLYLGTEFAAWVSIDRGRSWTRLNNNLPTVAVHEFAAHPTAGEIVAATHGRSLWVLDVTPLRQMTAPVVSAKAHLFEPNTVVRWRTEPQRGSPYGNGSRLFSGDNPPRGAQIYYTLGQKAQNISLRLVDHTGQTVRQLQARAEPGLHRVTWDLTRGQGPGQGAGGLRGGQGRGPGGGGPGGGGRQGQGQGQRPQTATPAATEQAPPSTAPATPQRGQFGGGFGFGAQQVVAGTYRVILSVDGQEFAQTVRVEADPTLPTLIAVPEDGDGAIEE